MGGLFFSSATCSPLNVQVKSSSDESSNSVNMSNIQYLNIWIPYLSSCIST